MLTRMGAEKRKPFPARMYVSQHSDCGLAHSASSQILIRALL